jgi:hypothetical protein
LVTGLPKVLLRIEGAGVLLAALYFYGRSDASWVLFAILILAPDVSVAGFLLGPKIGAYTYDIVHTEALPLAVIVGAVAQDNETLVSVGLIWLAHIGMDRVVGYGLKYPTAFRDTHLGRMGRRAA